MKNINPIYLIEGRFLNSLKKFWNADKKFAKQRYFGGRGKELFNSAKNKDMQAVRNLVGAELDAELMGSRITAADKAKYLRDLENYIQKGSDWKTARRELWDETKALPKRGYNGVKKFVNDFRNTKIPTNNTNKVVNTDFSKVGDSLPYVLAGGAGVVGLGAAMDN